MIDRLQPILSLLDEGIAIYRRDFLAFTLVTAIWFVPVAVASGVLIAVILGIMMRIKHPQPWDQTPLDGKRKAIALLTLIILVLCFVPFPIQIN